MEKRQLAEEAVNRIENVFGKHPGHRRAHARGELYEAVFSANGNAAPFTTAQHLQKGEVNAIVRFSHSSPNPEWTDVMSPVKGMAVQFNLPNGETTNIVGVNSPVFMAKTPEVFTEMMDIASSFKNGIPHLGELAKLVVKYPESRAAVDVLKKMHAPESFATGRYYSIHAFYFIDQNGTRRPVKYEWEPETGVRTLSMAEAASVKMGDYEAELENRVSRGAVHFQLNIVLGEEGDATDDPTVEWPAERAKLAVGRLSVMKKLTDADSIKFDPTVMTEGIECTEDKILNFRKDAYAISHERRMERE